MPPPAPNVQVRVRKVLGIPSRFSVPIVVATGFPKMPFRPSPRYPRGEVVYADSFGNPFAKSHQ